MNQKRNRAVPNKRKKVRPVTDEERERLRVAVAFIASNCGRRIILGDVANSVGLSEWHFHRRFGAAFGETVKQAITRQRIERAKGLILKGTPLSKVWKQCGFSHHSHFTSRFKKDVGVTPGKWSAARSNDRRKSSR